MPKVPEIIKGAMGIEGGIAGLAGAAMQPIQGGIGIVTTPATAGFRGVAGYRGATEAGWGVTRLGRLQRGLYTGWRALGGPQTLDKG